MKYEKKLVKNCDFVAIFHFFIRIGNKYILNELPFYHTSNIKQLLTIIEYRTSNNDLLFFLNLYLKHQRPVLAGYI